MTTQQINKAHFTHYSDDDDEEEGDENYKILKQMTAQY